MHSDEDGRGGGISKQDHLHEKGHTQAGEQSSNVKQKQTEEEYI